MRKFLQHQLRERDANLRTEFLGGATTFATMAYIVVVNPAILGTAIGAEWTSALMVATCVSAAVATLLMGLFTNYPIALAPGMAQCPETRIVQFSCCIPVVVAQHPAARGPVWDKEFISLIATAIDSSMLFPEKRSNEKLTTNHFVRRHIYHRGVTVSDIRIRATGERSRQRWRSCQER